MNFAHGAQNISSDKAEHQHAQIEMFLISAQTLHLKDLHFVPWRVDVFVTNVI